MAITDGNPVNATYTNEKLASKEDDNTLEGKQALVHNNVESGPDLLDIQKTINDMVAILAIIGQGNTGSNVGAGPGEVFKEKIGNDLRFRTLQGTNNVTITINGDEIEIGHPVEFLVADPGAPVANQLWFNYTDKVWRFFDGAVTTEIGADYVDLTTAQTAAGAKTWSDAAVFSSTVQVDGLLTANAGLTVNGTLTYVNTTDLEVTDALITVNKGGTDGTANGSGVETERPSGNGSIRFNDTLDNKYEVGLSSDLREVATIIKGTKAVLDALGTKYTSALYYATDENNHYTWNGTSLRLTSIPDLAKGSIVAGTATAPTEVPVSADGKVLRADSTLSPGVKWEESMIEDTKAAIDALTRKKGLTYYANDEGKFYYDNGTALVEISGGGGGGSTTKFQTKALSAPFAGTGVIADFTFNNLTIGVFYRITGNMQLGANSAAVNDKTFNLLVKNGATNLEGLNTAAENVSIYRATYTPIVVFEATDTTVTFTASSVSNMQMAGNGNLGDVFNSSYVAIEELLGHSVTTDFT